MRLLPNITVQQAFCLLNLLLQTCFWLQTPLPPPTPLTKPMLIYPKLYVVITAKCLKLQNRCIRVIFGAFWELFGAFQSFWLQNTNNWKNEVKTTKFGMFCILVKIKPNIYQKMDFSFLGAFQGHFLIFLGLKNQNPE